MVAAKSSEAWLAAGCGLQQGSQDCPLGEVLACSSWSATEPGRRIAQVVGLSLDIGTAASSRILRAIEGVRNLRSRRPYCRLPPPAFCWTMILQGLCRLAPRPCQSDTRQLCQADTLRNAWPPEVLCTYCVSNMGCQLTEIQQFRSIRQCRRRQAQKRQAIRRR